MKAKQRIYNGFEVRKLSKLYGLIKEDGTSEYNEGMKILILAACDSLRPAHVKNWYNTLPNGIILGYKGTVIGYQVSWALSKLNDYIKDNGANISNEAIVEEWEKINANLSDGQLWFGGGSLQTAVAINGPIREVTYIKFYDEVVTNIRFKTCFRQTNIYKKYNF